MAESNIVAGSNVYLARTDDPRLDPDFIAQILDYDLLKSIVDRRKTDSRIPMLSGEQMSIVHRGIRCTFAQNDPCIGYVEGKGTQVKCINIKCPGIYDRSSFYGKAPWKGCNPGVTEEYIKEWTPNPEDKKRYRRPDMLPQYYIVDMISDEEMSRYTVDPGNDGVDHPTPPAPVYKKPEPEGKSQSYKIDPKTGRKMVVIGYTKLIYPDEDGLGNPIWGFVEEVEAEKQPQIIHKAKKIEKKKEITQIKKVLPKTPVKEIDPDFARKAEFEKAVADNISDEIKLTEIESDSIEADSTLILVDNPAELSFVSSTFLVSGIDHSLHNRGGAEIALIDDYKKYSDRGCVLVSSTLLKSGCKESNVQAWKELSQRQGLIRLKMTDRDYYEFAYDSGSRWTCRNMYGVTHVCVDDDDLKEIESLNDGLYPVSLVDDGESYMVLRKNGEPLGNLGISFVNLIKGLKEKDEITATPQVIKGVTIKVVDGKAEILGMGHLKFIEY